MEVRQLELQPVRAPQSIRLCPCWPHGARTAYVAIVSWRQVGNATAPGMGSELSPESLVAQFRFGSQAGVSARLLWDSGSLPPSSICGGKLAVYPDNLRARITRLLGCWGFSSDKCLHVVEILK